WPRSAHRRRCPGLSFSGRTRPAPPALRPISPLGQTKLIAAVIRRFPRAVVLILPSFKNIRLTLIGKLLAVFTLRSERLTSFIFPIEFVGRITGFLSKNIDMFAAVAFLGFPHFILH